MTFHTSASNKCSIDGIQTDGIVDLYNTAQISMNAQLLAIESSFDTFKDDFDAFVEDVENAISEANRFFDSIGVVITYLNDDLGIVSNEICGISNSDDWCDMSKMNWYVNRPLYRDSVNFNISVATALTSPPSSYPSS